MSLGTLMCWIVLFVVLGNVDPTESGSLGFVFFYLSLFLSLTGTFAVIGFFIKEKFSKSEVVIFKHVRRSFQQGVLISGLLVISLFMLQFKFLNWLTGVLLIIIFLIIESIVSANRKFKNQDYLSH